jgi:hypothetical protein
VPPVSTTYKRVFATLVTERFGCQALSPAWGPLTRKQLADLLVPAPGDLLGVYRVSTVVNSARNNGRELIEPAVSQSIVIPRADLLAMEAKLRIDTRSL